MKMLIVDGKIHSKKRYELSSVIITVSVSCLGSV